MVSDGWFWMQTARTQKQSDMWLCEFCNFNTCETESHFLLDCSFYEVFREAMYANVLNVNPDFHTLSESEKNDSIN